MEHRKVHRRMMDARYYLGNGVAHPFTTGSSAGRSFRLPRLFFFLSHSLSKRSFGAPVFISRLLRFAFPCSPLERRSPFVRPVSGDRDPRPVLESEHRPRRNHPPDAATFPTFPRACEQKRRYGELTILERESNADRNCENGETSGGVEECQMRRTVSSSGSRGIEDVMVRERGNQRSRARV